MNKTNETTNETKELYEKLLSSLVLTSVRMHDHLLDLHGSKGTVDDLIEIFTFLGIQNLDKDKFTEFASKVNAGYVRTADSSKLTNPQRNSLFRRCIEQMCRNANICKTMFDTLKARSDDHLDKSRLAFNLGNLFVEQVELDRILRVLDDKLYLNLSKLDSSLALISQSEEQIEANMIDLDELDNYRNDNLNRQRMFYLLNTLIICFVCYLIIKRILT